MTVIVWDGTTLAADKMASFGDGHRTVRKVYRSGDHLLAFAGDFASGLTKKAWFEAGAIPAHFPSDVLPDGSFLTAFYVIRRDGSYIKFEGTPTPLVYDDKTFTAGTGCEFAAGAMAMGADAAAAVRIASSLCITCGNGIDTLTFI